MPAGAFSSAHDERAHGVTLAYAALKWGKISRGNRERVCFRQALEIQREQARGFHLDFPKC
jgi:hypothetical protein